MFSGTYQFQGQVLVLKPKRTEENQAIEHFRGAIFPNPPRPDNYTIYIGGDVTQATERLGGIEVPAQVLEDLTQFREEVLHRLRRYIGSPQDN